MTHCAAILAGGLGTRLRPVVNDRPKVMASVAGRPFLTRLLDQLSESGIRRTILCTGYRGEMIHNELGDRYLDMELVYSVEESPLGTGGALKNAVALVSGETLLVLNGDSYCNCNLADFIIRHAASGAAAGMVLVRVDDVSRFGAVRIDDDSLVESFIEKGGQSGSGFINAGVYLLPTSLIREIVPGRAVSLEREVIPHVVAGGVFGYQCRGPFIDIGIPDEYRRAQLFFSEELKGNP